MTSGGKAPVTSTPEQQQKTNDGNTKSPKTNENNEEENISENATILTTKTEETGKEEEKEEESEESELKQNENPQQKQKNHLRPDEYNDGLWDAEPFYYCTNGPTTARGYVPSDEQSGAGKRQKRGLIYKKRENVSGGAANEYECFQSHEGIVYRHGDHVFVESCREDPFLVGSIVSFKMKKRDQLLVKLLRYYRPNDVPELSYSLVTQARIEEGQYSQSTASPHSLHCRELFSSETTLLFHVAALRWAADRLTPLRSEMRSLSSGGWGGGSSSPRMSQRSLIFRTHVGDTLEEEDDEYLDNFQGGVLDSDRLKQHNRHHLPILSADNIVDEDVSPSSPSSSSNSDGGRTYEMSEEESSEFFELSAPLQDALETINDHLMQEAMKTSLKMGEKSEKQQQEQQPKNNQLEWAYKYAQHEWLKMATKKNTNAEAVEQFIDALESYSTQLMDTVINMTDQNGNTALHYAVSNENFDVISVLLDSKVCRIDQMNTAGYSTLMLGALCELRNETESAIMQRLFHMGNVNAKAVKHAQTALMLAASHGRIEATNLLLKCGADVNIQDVDGSTALMCAAEHGQKEIVKILLKQPNIDASLNDCDNQTALSIAVENHYRDIGVLIYAHLNFSRSTEVASTSNSSSTLTTQT
uniref:Uncharacterized protein n=3 Tax=Meloidogyne TaxID=189290 RepID=A0A6V7X2T7_MELEN|nr:unnamed protein product [Meloidogyne enterolobii]